MAPKTSDRVRARRALFARNTSRAGNYAMLQPQRAIAKVSSAALRTVGEAADAQKGRVHRNRERQARAYEIVDDVSELDFIVNLKANLVARCDLVLQEAVRLEDGGVDWIPTVDDRARRVDAAFVGPQGGQAELKRRSALHLSTAGEFHLLATAAGDDGSIVWEVLSVIELLIEPSGVYRRRDGVQREEVPADNYTARCWRSASDFCADEITEILTEDGWQRHDQLSEGDVVLTLNHETGLTEWQPVRAVNRFEVADKPMLAMDHQRHSSLTTLDHRWPVIKKNGVRTWTTSRDLRTTDRIVTAAPCADLPTEAKYSDDFVELVAWFWTEGHIIPCVRGDMVSISQSAEVNSHYEARIRKLLHRLFGEPGGSRTRADAVVCSFDGCTWPMWARGLCKAHDWQRRDGRELVPVRRVSEHPGLREALPRWSQSKERAVTEFTLNRVVAADLLDVAPNRVVSPHFLRSLTQAQLLLFIEISINADGSRHRKSGTEVLPQGSRDRAESFAFACVLAGKTPQWTYGVNKTHGRPIPYWGVTVNRQAVTEVSRQGLLSNRLNPGYEGLPELLARTRRDRGHRLKDVAALCGVGAGTVQQWEKGTRYPSPDLTGRLADYLDLPPESLRTSGAAPATYSGTVWCPTTPNHSWCARRNDKIFFTGNSDLASSEVLRVLPLAEQVVRLDQALQAVVDSKLAAQMMYVPTEMSFADSEDDEGAESELADGDDIDPFTEELVKHLSDPIKDRRSTAALVPLVLRGPADMHDKIHLIDLGRTLDAVYQDMRKEVLERMFHALDAPPEMISGKSGLSGLGGGNVAISIDKELVDKHVLPLGELEADFFTVAYLRPMLETFEGLKPEESQNFRYSVDPAKILSTGDEPQAADRLHKADKLSDEAYVKASGFEVADMPKPDELAARRTWALIESAPGVFAPVLLNRVPGFEDVDVSKLGAAGPGSAPLTAAPTNGTGPVAPTNGRYLPASVEMLGRTLVVAADAAVERALEKAGSAIVAAAGRHADTTLRDRLRSVSKLRALTVIGPEDLTTLRTSVPKLLDGAWDSLAVRSRGWIRQYLLAEGMDNFEADDRAALAANLLCTAVHEYVLEYAHTGLKVGTNGLRLPDAVVLVALDQFVPVS